MKHMGNDVMHSIDEMREIFGAKVTYLKTPEFEMGRSSNAE